MSALSIDDRDRESRIAGVMPWLPWPLSAWRAWTEPVRAERLAALRIGLAAFLLFDILVTYLPGVFTFFDQDSLGNPAIYSWRTGAPRLTWSLLRGFGDPLVSFLALVGWGGTTLWILGDLLTRTTHGDGPRDRDALRYSVPLWGLSGALFVLGMWARMADKRELDYVWLVAVPLVAMALAFYGIDVVRRLLHGESGQRRSRAMLLMACVGAELVLAAGLQLSMHSQLRPASWWARVLGPWQHDAILLCAAMIVWAASTGLLLVGLWTRPAAIVSWAMSISFATINSSIDNAGDTIRIILQFYLMFCPCGAVWSVDRLWRRWRGHDASLVYVSPWPIRVLFVQLVFIYFCNGLYKLFGGSWREGESLFYVLADFTLTRFSPTYNPLPLWALRVMTWTVLVWEVSFPVLVLHRWTRFAALCVGVAFHLGILASMELGCFVPYALCIYLPFLPWERWLGPTAFYRKPSITEVQRG